MSDSVFSSTHLILPVGTQIVTLVEVAGPDGETAYPPGSVGVIVKAPVVLFVTFFILWEYIWLMEKPYFR